MLPLAAVPRVMRRARRDLARLALLASVLLAGCFNTLDWREFKSDEGRYTITFPAIPVNAKHVLNSPLGNVTMQMDSASAGDALFAVGFAHYPPDYLSRATPGVIMDEVRDSLMKNIGARNASEAPLLVSGHPGRSLHAEGRNDDRVLTLDARLVFSGDRFYQVVVIGNAGAGRVSKDALDLFFNSFRITQ
jgi:hypothetical protein